MKIVLIHSGGMDSTTLLYWLRNNGNEVKALGIFYGQRHATELDMAAALCEEIDVPFDIADLGALQTLLAGSSLTSPEIEVPEGHYEDESMKATVVPNRNMIMLSVAIGHAISLGYSNVGYAAHAGDHAIYPDCRPAFAQAMAEVAGVCSYEPVTLHRPFIDMSKAQVVEMGVKLKVPYEKTWSCYKGEDVHCGKCGTCVERIEAFQLAVVKDPTVYASEII